MDPVGKMGFQTAKNNFEYVEAMHTSAGFSILEQMGHIDFYPNGGSIQPCVCSHPCPDIDCESDWRQKSNHKRAPAYFEESILSAENFLGTIHKLRHQKGQTDCLSNIEDDIV